MSAQTSEKKKPGDYTEDSVQALEGIEHVRLRPAMYIGDTHERGLHHLINEVVDNSVDEALAGECTEIFVTLNADGSCTVLDNGRGIPVGINKKLGVSTVEVCLTKIGAGAKFDKGTYKVSGGLHGVGVSCVNALSTWLEVEVYRDGFIHHQRYERGKPIKPLEKLGPTKKRGTKVTFLPDPEIFRLGNAFKFETAEKRLKDLAYLNKGLLISLRDERGEGRKQDFKFDRGLMDYVEHLATEEPILKAPIYITGSEESKESGGTVEVEVAMTWVDAFSETILSYANNINTHEGGTHLTGLRTAITQVFNKYIEDNQNLIKDKDKKPSGDHYRQGLIAVVSVKVPEPQFEGQTKTKLGNSDIAGVVQSVVAKTLKVYVEENPRQAEGVVKKALLAKKMEDAAKAAKEAVAAGKDAMKRSPDLVKKLRECEKPGPDAELFLVEGDSAGGTATQGRETMNQAILPLRGKILNVWKTTPDKMLTHNEIKVIVQALGTGIMDDFDIAKLRYGKIIIMCDADVDGSHIRTLILTFFFRQMPQLIQQGKVYIAQPPLYKVTKGKNERYVKDERKFREEMLENALKESKLQRVDKDVALEGLRLRRLVEIVQDLDKLGREVVKKGARTFEGYAAQRHPQTKLFPWAKIVDAREKGKVAAPVYTADDEKVVLDGLLAKKPDLKIWADDDKLEDKEQADVLVTRFKNKGQLEHLVKELESLGFELGHLFKPKPTHALADDDGEAHVAPFKILTGEGETVKEHPMESLAELPERLRKIGQQGIKVQRFKGLGEMNADELRDTTMDPSQRTLLKVELDDLGEAQRIFTVLMGTKVEPRRDFIDRHALEVTNLDV